MLKRHRKPEYKLRGFVAILFLCIVFLVGFAHVYYNQQVLQVSCFACRLSSRRAGLAVKGRPLPHAIYLSLRVFPRVT